MANPNKVVRNFCATKAKSPERQAEEMRRFAETDFAKDCERVGKGEMTPDAFKAKHFPDHA